MEEAGGLGGHRRYVCEILWTLWRRPCRTARRKPIAVRAARLPTYSQIGIIQIANWRVGKKIGDSVTADLSSGDIYLESRLDSVQSKESPCEVRIGVTCADRLDDVRTTIHESFPAPNNFNKKNLDLSFKEACGQCPSYPNQRFSRCWRANESRSLRSG